jgi:hypothetical protein
VRRSLGIGYSGYDRLEQAYLGGRMISTYLRAPTLYRDYLGRRRAWMYWVINPELRSTLFTLNGTDEFMFYTKPKDPEAQPDASLTGVFCWPARARSPSKSAPSIYQPAWKKIHQ